MILNTRPLDWESSTLTTRSGPNLTVSQLTAWAENAVKFKPELSKKWKRKPSRNEVGMEWKQNVGSFIPIFHDFAAFLQIFSKL